MRPDDEGFLGVFREEYANIARLAYMMLGDRAAAEDVAQEAFTRLYARWGTVSRYERPGAWVRRVAIRLSQRWRDRRRMEQQSVSQSASSDSVTPYDAEVRRAILGLPAGQRAAIILHYLEDRPVREVAEIMGCATSTAKVHLHRGRKRLRAMLGERGHDVR